MKIKGLASAALAELKHTSAGVAFRAQLAPVAKRNPELLCPTAQKACSFELLAPSLKNSRATSLQ